MADYIEREAVLAEVDKEFKLFVEHDDALQLYSDVRCAVIYAPAADGAPVRHGHWIDGADSFGAKRGAYRVCSHCNICIPNTKMVPDRYWQGCPNCLTRMDVTDTNVGDK